MAYRVESGIPRRQQRKYPFDLMAVGDSFLAPDRAPYQVYAASRAYSKAHHGAKFSCVKEGRGCRCFRIA